MRLLSVLLISMVLVIPAFALEKNVASQKWVVFAFDDTDNSAKTGDAGNITANLRIDGAAANAVDDTNPTELEDGYYIFDLTQAETNGDYILICPASSTADIQVIGVPGAVWTTAENHNALGIESDGDLTKVNTLDGHTAQTGDSYAIVNNGTYGNSALKTLIDAVPTASEIQTELEENGASTLDTISDKLPTNYIMGSSVQTDKDDEIDNILTDTGEIGAAGAGLTAVPYNSAWNADIQSECADALTAYDPPTHAEVTTAVGDVSVDEIQATALADLFNTDSTTDYASSVSGSVVKEIADNAGGSGLTEAGIADAVWDEPRADHTTGNTFGGDMLDNDTWDNTKAGYLDEAISGIDDDPWDNASRTITGLTAAALADFFDTDSGTDYASSVAGSVVKETADNAGGSSLTESGIADAVWDEALSGHTSAGTTGEKLDDIPLSGTGDWTAGEKSDILEALSVDDSSVDTDLDDIKLQIKIHR